MENEEGASGPEPSHVEAYRLLLDRLMVASEHLRGELALRMRDEILPKLGQIDVGLEQAESVAETTGAFELLDRIRDTRELLKEQMGELDDLTIRLGPPLVKFGLAGLLASYAKWFEWALSVRCMLHVGKVEMTDEVQAALAAIAQEALTNIIRHARPALVRISLHGDGGRVQLHISDDGVGFDPAAVQPTWNRLGLVAIRERAAIHGGTAVVDSAPGEGTSVTVSIPLGGRA